MEDEGNERKEDPAATPKTIASTMPLYVLLALANDPNRGGRHGRLFYVIDCAEAMSEEDVGRDVREGTGG
jgi:hypothetical protein